MLEPKTKATGSPVEGIPGRSPQVRRKVTQALPSGRGRFAGLAREGHVFLRRILGRFSRGEFVFVLISLVGILSILLLVTASVAYLALPRGKLCPHCGGVTDPVVLRRLLRILSPWVQWRWCPRCAWEGPRLRGPDLGPLDPPVDHDSGFRWGDPDYENVPIFYWRTDHPGGNGEPRPDPMPSGLKWQAEEDPTGPTEPDSPGSYFPPPWELKPPHFPWGPGVGGRPRPPARRRGRTPRPWYLSWLVSKNPPGFYWKERRD